MKVNQSTRRRQRAVVIATLLSLLFSLMPGLQSSTVYAHNLDQRMNWIQYDEATMELFNQRIDEYQNSGGASGLPLMRVDDELGMIIKVTPTDGTTTGVGGYVTFYVPDGVQVMDAGYMSPDASGGFVLAPMKGQAIEPLGYGPIGPAETTELIGLNLTNSLGQNSDAVASDGTHLGTMAGVYADTGIFYSTDPDTAWESWANSSPPDGGVIKSNSGDEFIPYNKWDGEQMYAWGSKSPNDPIVDPNGRGSAPWGMASGVAGPQSGYEWGFDLDIWNGSNMQSAIVTGPWNRIQYPGSQIAYDEPGRTDNTLGFAGIDAANIGHDLSAAPLPITTGQANGTPNAIRWSVGALIENRPEYVFVKVKLTNQFDFPDDNCYDAFNADVFGGDAGGEDGGKDHLWRYYDPTIASLSTCIAINKRASRVVAGTDDVFEYDIEVINTSGQTYTNMQIVDTLPGEVEFLNASPHPDSGPNPLVWNLPSLAPGEKFEATVTVKAKSGGVALNELCVSSDQTPEQCIDEGTPTGDVPLLQQSKTANPETIEPGDTVQYTLTIDNIGAGASDSPVEIVDYLPGGFTYVSLDSVTANNANAIGFTEVDASNPNVPIFEVDRSINPGKAIVLTFTAQSPNDVTPGLQYCNTYVTRADAVISTGTLACITVGGNTIGDRVWRDWNGDGVQDPAEEGISGVQMTINGSSAQNTGTDGLYLYSGLNDDSYTVNAATPTNHNPTTPNPLGVNIAGNQEILTVDFGFQPSGVGAIGDLVFEDKGNDGNYDPGLGDVGINGVDVTLYHDENGDGIVDPATDAFIAQTTTVNGDYLFSGLALDYDYVVVVDHADIQAHFDAAAFPGAPWTASTDDPQTVSDLPGSYLTADFGYYEILPGSIGDEVFIDSNNNGTYEEGVDTPLPFVTVELRRQSDNVLVGTTTTSITGTYTFEGLGPDDYIVTVDENDANIPANHELSPTYGTNPILYTLGVSENYTGADFPFVYVPPPPSPLNKQVNKANANPGDTLKYVLSFDYNGSDLLTNVVITDVTPIGTTYVGNSAAPTPASQPADNATGTVQWDLGSNTPGVPGYGAGSGPAPSIDTTGMLLFSSSADDNPAEYRTWNGSSFDVPGTAENMGGYFREIYGVAGSTRQEIIMIGANNGAEVEAQIWDGSTWTDVSNDPNLPSPLGDQSQSFFRSSSVAYEQLSGDAVMVWDDNTQAASSELRYSVWDGSSWTAPATVTPPAGQTGEPNIIEMASKPGSDELVLVTGTTTGDWAAVWNGSSWGNAVTLFNGAQSEYTEVDVSYEQQSGEALVIYASATNTDANLYYRTWNGSVWNGPFTLAAPVGVTSRPDFSDMASDPNSNRISLGITTNSTGTWLNIWDGSTWATSQQASASNCLGSTGTNVYDCVAVAFESDTGEALAVYTVGTNAYVAYRTLGAGSSVWSNQNTVTPTGISTPNTKMLYADPYSDEIMLAVQDGGPDLYMGLWNGGGWDTISNLGQTADIAKNQPWEFVWDDVQKVTRAVSQSTDDAEEIGPDGLEHGGPGSVYVSSSDLELVDDIEPTTSGNQTVGIRFQNISVPPGATITNAYMTFHAVDADSPNTNNNVANLAIQGQAADNAATFVDSTNNTYSISTRPRTTASTAWAPTTSWSAGNTYDTPDLSAVVQEIVDRSNWASDNAMVFIVTGSGSRSANVWDYSGDPAELRIEYKLESEVALGNVIAAAPTLITAGDQVTVTMTLTSSDSIANVGPNTLIVTGTNGVNATMASGPTPATGTVDSSGTTFTWVYNTSGTGNLGRLFFGGDADDGATTWPKATSNSVIVAPPLTFQVDVDTVGAPPIIENTGYISEGGGSIPDQPSNTVETVIGSSIGDFVWADLDGNGQFDTGEPGLANIEVCATNGVETHCDTTDGDGAYLITGLGADTWVVALTPSTIPPGYVATTSAAISVSLGASQQYLDADFGLRPPGTASIGDTVWNDANADGIVQTTEAPLPNVRVTLYQDIGGVFTPIDTMLTDENGYYLFEGLYGATYRVEIDETGTVTSPFDSAITSTIADAMTLVSVDGNTATPANPHEITISDGQAYATADFGYQWDGEIGDYVWWDDNADGIQNEPANRAIADVIVLLYYDVNGNGQYDGSFIDIQVGFGQTNASGVYWIENLPPGAYLVDVYEDSITTDGDRDVVPTTDNIVYVDLGLGESYPDADFGYYEGSIIGDTVWHDMDSNGVQSVGEPGLDGVRVYLYDSTGTVLVDTQVTDADGLYKFVTLPGSYVVSVESADIPGSLSTATTPLTYPLTVAAGQSRLDNDFGFDHSGTIGDLVFRDSNDNGVYEPAGGETGLGGVTVNLYENGVLINAQATEPDGGYLFEGLPGGTYTVTVDSTTLPAGYAKSAIGPDNKAEPYTVNLPEGGNDLSADFGYVKSGGGGQSQHTISGFIWHDVDGNGLPDDGFGSVISGVDVTVDCGPDGIYQTTSDSTPVAANWVVNVDIAVEPGSCTITVDTDDLPSTGYVNTGDPDENPPANTVPGVCPDCDNQTIVSVSGDVSGQNFGYQEQLGSIAGTVCEWNSSPVNLGQCEANEDPLTPVTITLTYEGPDGVLGTGDDVVNTTHTNANGDYSFTDLLPGDYEIVETNLPGYTSVADADGFDPDVINVTPLLPGEDITGRDFEDQGPPNPDYAITKTANVDTVRAGDIVEFTIRIENTGNTTLTSVPLEDRYNTEGPYLTFVGMTPTSAQPDDLIDDGTINWADLTAAPPRGVGFDLAPNQFVEVTLEFVARLDTTLLPGGVTINYAEGKGVTDGINPAVPDKLASDDVAILNPTAALVVDRSVSVEDEIVTLTWRTLDESNMESFQLYRTDVGGERTLITDQPIAAQHAGQPVGADYSYEDAAVDEDAAVRYQLELTMLDGNISLLDLGAVTRGQQIFLPVINR